jgi:exodeoxyribonuclease V alpha subunit
MNPRPLPALAVQAPWSVDDDFVPSYLGWEIARCALGLTSEEQRALAALAGACIAQLQAGSTRMPVDDARLSRALAAIGAESQCLLARSLLERARRGGDDPVCTVVGRAGDRKPLVVEGDWLSTERMRAVEERFCDRIRGRRSPAGSAPSEEKSLKKILQGVAGGPPALSEEQKGAVREALTAKLALVTGGPGTGKTTIVVALLRALHWRGVPMESVALAAPTGKAAHRLDEAVAAGVAAVSGLAGRDIAEAGLAASVPHAQTLHRLLGWSPERGRYARHENDPLPHAIIVVDEASMIDLAMMDRLVRALGADARLVLLGDADQLPSVEAGAVFRDLCAALRTVRLTKNLRVAADPGAARIVTAARAVNEGKLDARGSGAIETRRAAADLAFEAVEHLEAPFASVGAELLERWWSAHLGTEEAAASASRVYETSQGTFLPQDQEHLRVLLRHYTRARILCATRVQGAPACAEAINASLLARMTSSGGSRRRKRLPPGAPVLVQRNDYERGLFNGDQGVVVEVDAGEGAGPSLMAVFARGQGFDAWPVDEIQDLTAAFAMTVHKAQGSEFDRVLLVLPGEDLPLLTRELVYTAITRARRSVAIVGARDLLVRAASRSIERHSGIAERLVSI